MRSSVTWSIICQQEDALRLSIFGVMSVLYSKLVIILMFMCFISLSVNMSPYFIIRQISEVFLDNAFLLKYASLGVSELRDLHSKVTE